MLIFPPLPSHGPRRRSALVRHVPSLVLALTLAACASAAGGTWAYQAELPDGDVEGLIVLRNQGGELEGMHRFSARETFPSPSEVTCPYETCELCPDAKVCATRYFITAGIENSGRAAAGGAVNPELGTRWTRLLLNDDGQSLEISFWTPLRFLTTEAHKVQGATCAADYEYVRDVARWANRGFPIPVLGVE
jgi:hypothetical protein